MNTAKDTASKDAASKDASNKDADKARSDAAALAAKAEEAKAKAAEDAKTPEQKKIEKLNQDADDARAKAEQADREAHDGKALSTALDAKVLAPIDPSMSAGHHMAQKFGNDPANPKGFKPEFDLPENKTVRLSRVSPDSKEPIRTTCHPEMVGDYVRAGWNKDDYQPGTPVLTDEEKAERDERERKAESVAA